VDDFLLEAEDRQKFFEQEQQLDGECTDNIEELHQEDGVHEVQFTFRRCGICREPGHDRRTCSMKQASPQGGWRGFS